MCCGLGMEKVDGPGSLKCLCKCGFCIAIFGVDDVPGGVVARCGVGDGSDITLAAAVFTVWDTVDTPVAAVWVDVETVGCTGPGTNCCTGVNCVGRTICKDACGKFGWIANC